MAGTYARPFPRPRSLVCSALPDSLRFAVCRGGADASTQHDAPRGGGLSHSDTAGRQLTPSYFDLPPLVWPVTPLPSSTVKMRSTPGNCTFSTVPPGQWISRASTLVLSPRPKWTLWSFEDA